MTVALARGVEDYLKTRCADATKLVNDLICLLREQQQKHFAVTPALKAWLLEAADKPVTPLTESDFKAIRGRVQKRLKTSPV